MQVHTCPPALGFSFAAGTTDGPGEFNFVQGQSLVNYHHPSRSGIVSIGWVHVHAGAGACMKSLSSIHYVVGL